MLRVTDNGVYFTKDDIFNVLLEVTPFNDSANYTCRIFNSATGVDLECSLFRDKYVRLYKQVLDLKAGVYLMELQEGNDIKMTKFVIIEEVSHNE